MLRNITVNLKMHSSLHQVKDRVCVTKYDGVFVLLVNAFPVDEETDSKDFKLTCKLNVLPRGVLMV